jgi:hypothetical protein
LLRKAREITTIQKRESNRPLSIVRLSEPPTHNERGEPDFQAYIGKGQSWRFNKRFLVFSRVADENIVSSVFAWHRRHISKRYCWSRSQLE